jgi:hypothetical protein
MREPVPLADSAFGDAGPIGPAKGAVITVRATLRAAVFERFAGTCVRRQTDPLRAPVGRPAIVAGPPGLTSVRSAVIDRWQAPADTDVTFRACWIGATHVHGVTALLVAALLGAVTFWHALALEVADVRLDGAIVVALAFMEHFDAGAAGLAPVPVGLSIDAAHGLVDVKTHAGLADPVKQRIREIALSTDEAWRAFVVVETLIGLWFRENPTFKFEWTERCHVGNTAKSCLLAIACEYALALVLAAQDWRFQKLEARRKRLPEPQHLVGVNSDDANDAGDLRALALCLEAIIPTRIDAALILPVSLEALDELVGRSETTLAVLLPLAGRLLIAFVDWPPFAGARDVDALFHAQLVATSSAHATFTRRLFAVSEAAHADPCTCGFAFVDVVSAIAPTNWLEDAGAVAARGSRDAPRRRAVGTAVVSDEAILRRVAAHGLFAAASMGDLAISGVSLLERIRLSVGPTDEPLGGSGIAASRRLPATCCERHEGDHCYQRSTPSDHRTAFGNGSAYCRTQNQCQADLGKAL